MRAGRVFQRDATVPKVNCAPQTRRYPNCDERMDFDGISTRMKLDRKMASQALAVIACLLLPSATRAATDKLADDAALSAAICPIVYPVDQSPSDRGFHYLFYGNGFFINEQGYLITAAHVLSQLHGGQPYILLRQLSGPPRFVLATLVVVDRDHDVAILRATPNPFDGKFKVGFLPLAYDWLMRGHAVLAASLRPSKPLDAYTLDASVDDRSSGEVFDFQFSQLDKGRSETELFLFNHQVRRGQSGAPIVSAECQGVVGFVEGQWLRSSLVPLATATDEGTPGVGAAVPIHYAIALLQQRGIPWHTASGALAPPDNSAGQTKGFSAPVPLSLLASPYPSQALFGGEVVLDALIDSRGRLVELKVVRGPSPFLETVLSTVRTWSFFPAHLDGRAVAARIGITFQFSQSYEPPRSTPAHTYDEPLASSAERGAQPVATVEPKYPANAAGDGSVILYDLIGRQGQLTSVQILRDSESLTSAAVAAVHQWIFVPGRRAGADADSAAIVVVEFRHAGGTQSIQQTKWLARHSFSARSLRPK
jgi:outer membrane biosynthesis protein TonB